MTGVQNHRRNLISMTGKSAIALLLVCAGCRNLVTPEPRGPVSGRWIGNVGTDSWTELRLDERGHRVTGTIGGASVNFGGQFFPSASVLGYASSAGVTLGWSEHDGSGQVYRTVVHAVLSADGRTLSGTRTVNDGPTGAFGYGRAAAGTP